MVTSELKLSKPTLIRLDFARSKSLGPQVMFGFKLETWNCKRKDHDEPDTSHIQKGSLTLTCLVIG